MKFLPPKLLILMLPMIAHGHHPMGGDVPGTMVQGLMSGFGHPIIELNHLLFIVAFAALLAVCNRHVIAHVSLFLMLAATGTIGRLMIPDIPYFDAGVLFTTLVVGLLLIFRKLDYVQVPWLLAPVAGLLHGYAYGAAVVGAENKPLFSYLVGFSLIQAALMLGIICGVRHLAKLLPGATVTVYRSVSGIAVIFLSFIA
jgi:urease accessory protein